LILSEDCNPSDDDTLERVKARELLLKKTMGLHGKNLIDAARCGPNLEVVWTTNSFDQVLSHYKDWRDQAKDLMQGNDANLPFGRIDRHKISAAFMMAIIHVKPLRLISKEASKIALIKYLNHALAFKTAVSILAIFSQHDKRVGTSRTGQLKMAVFPEAKGPDYLEHAYRALAHASGGDSKQLTLPVLAHWMFYIENYWLMAETQKTK
jgi:hypothetical protein